MAHDFPLTSPQAGIWLDGLSRPDKAAYNLAEVIRCDGPLDADAFRRAAVAADGEADALSLRLRETDGMPRQILGDPRADFALIDLSGAEPGIDPEALAMAECRAAAARPLDPARGPMTRHRLIRLAADRHWWLRTYHHMAMDGFGAAVIAQRMAEIYEALIQGRQPPPSWLGRYLDFIAADAAYADSERARRDAEYWRDRSPKNGAPTRFPAARATSDDAPAETVAGDLTPSDIDRIAALAATLSASTPAVLLSAYLLLLGREAETAAPVCATPLLNRMGREERATVGLFTSVAPIHARLDEAETFSALISQVARRLRGDLRHMRMTAARMRRFDIDPWGGGDPRGAVFNALDFPRAVAIAGTRTSSTILSYGPVDDVSLVFNPGQSDPSGRPTPLVWYYNPARHDEAGIARRADRFRAILDAALADPNVRLEDIPRLGKAEDADIRAWEQGPPLPAQPPQPVHLRFLAEAARRSDAPAVTAGGRTTTYADLAATARAAAARLAAEGVKPEEPVGLCLAPSAEQIAGFLGILISGAASLQLDPLQPPARLRAMIAGVGCRTVLTDRHGLGLLPDDGSVRAIRLDDPDAPLAAAPAFPAATVAADRLACIYHTSGSTGRPKPVGLTHGGLAAKMPAAAALFGLGDGDECVAITLSVGFDPWQQQVLMPLCSGNRLWIPDRSLILDAVGFWTEAAAQGVTHLNLVPSMLESLLPGAPENPLPRLRRIILGGERLDPGLAARAATLLRTDAVWNMYGPTETTIDATAWRIDPAAPARETPIGRPVAGYTVRILDDRLRRAPVGAISEICIGGFGVARGYLGMAEETAAAFVADPFAPGQRLYRTGDRAQWRDDGAILFRGRFDDQVKIRGQRIELGEVEAALRRQEGVAEAAAVFDKETGTLTAHVAGSAAERDLRARLAALLPAAAVPGAWTFHKRLPRLASGKIDRAELARAVPARAAPPSPAAPARGRRLALQRTVGAVWAELLGRDRIDPDANLFEIGVHSLMVPKAQVRLGTVTGQTVSAVDIFRHPSVAAFAAHLSGEDETDAAAPTGPRETAGEDRAIAVIGLGFRFPGAADDAALWRLLLDGAAQFSQPDAALLRAAGLDDGLLADPAFVGAHARLPDLDRFDAAAFGYTAGDAATIDPQQRLLLETARHALDSAACDPRREGPVGVFAGTGFGSYAFDNLFDRIHRRVGAERYATVIANDKDFAALRIAYKLGLTGPAVSVGTACSTGLVAVTLAVQALREGRCRVALAGAAAIGLTSAGGYLSVEGGIGSPSGRCRPFDAQADGTVGGSGAAVVALKRLSDARADGDRILAVIRGVGCRNDGAERAAFTAPGAEGQAATLSEALADAGIDPASVGFVEGHGTGTALGDPIEVAGLNRAYRGAPPGSILLGSVKGNLGHLDAAAGLAGLIKAILALRHGVVPPTAGFAAPNPQAPFAEGPFRVNAAAEPWPERADGLPRRAAVSSFGLGGTNAHVVLEQAPDARPDPAAEAEPRPEILALSAATPAALDRMTADLAARLTGADAPALADAAHTLQTGRRRLPLRRAVVARTSGEAAAKLSGGRGVDGRAAGGAVGVAFLFPGQGSQYPGMGRALYREEPLFRATVDEAAELLKDTAAHAVRDLLLADPDDAEAARRLADTAITQPALFVVETGIARVLSGWGIEPDALIGHSVGELVAACLAGTLSFPAALSLVALRGRLMGSAPRGTMLAISAPEAEVRALLAETGDDRLAVAAVNGPRQCVVAGPDAAVAAVASRLGDRPSQRLNTSHAFHCALMDGILADFAQAVAQVPLSPPAIPFVSNLGGDWIGADEATDPAYWARHLRGAVRFADGVRTLRADQDRLLVEVGPGAALSRLARAIGVPEADIAATAPEIGREADTLREAAARLWLRGVEPDWAAIAPGPRRKAELPPYPFDRARLWIDPAHPAPPSGGAAADTRTTQDGNETLDAVLAVWGEVFGLSTVPPDADFFALGGDSMIAVRIAARLGERLGTPVATAQVLAAATPRRIADALDGAPDVERGTI